MTTCGRSRPVARIIPQWRKKAVTAEVPHTAIVLPVSPFATPLRSDAVQKNG